MKETISTKATDQFLYQNKRNKLQTKIILKSLQMYTFS